MQENALSRSCGHAKTTALALAAMCVMFPLSARAACGFSPGTGTTAIFPAQIAPEAQKGQQASPGVTSPSTTNGEAQAVIVGLWAVEFTPDAGPPYQGFDVWHSDGTEILNDNSVAPAAGNVCVGIWKQTSGGTIQLKHPAWNFDADGVLHGTLALLETITVEPGGNSYHGRFTLKEFDLMGNFTNESTGQLRAHRVTVD